MFTNFLLLLAVEAFDSILQCSKDGCKMFRVMKPCSRKFFSDQSCVTAIYKGYWLWRGESKYGSTTVSSQRVDGRYEKAYDGDMVSTWHSLNTAPSWFEVKFNAPRIICFVKIRRRHDGISSMRYKNMKVILYGNDHEVNKWVTTGKNGAPYNLDSG